MKGSVLIIDDEEELRKLLGRLLGLEGLEVYQASDLRQARSILARSEIQVILCDVKLPDGNGINFVIEARKNWPQCEIILLTAYGNIPDGVTAIKHGAFDYITKGDDNDRIIPLLAQALERSTQHYGQRAKITQATSFESILGNSRPLREAVALARKIAPSSTTVLLLGETGTGKEVFAKAIHSASPRSRHAMVALNCSAFARDLLEGELFGHKAGAYTSASKDKKGLLEMADGGTLFLDEIGELESGLQAKLLRVLENGEFIKLGDTKVSKVDLRIIAATNRLLEQEVANGKFREDLYYRLNSFTISLPALRDRQEDIPALSKFFLEAMALKNGLPQRKISEPALALLQQHSWKGNIRELKNVLERANILAEDNTIQPADLPAEIQHPREQSSALLLSEVERLHILKMLHHTGNNKTKTASLLGIGIATLYRKLEEYGLNK